jgi:carbonic anhydrase
MKLIPPENLFEGKTSRRHFLKATLACAGGVLLGSELCKAAAGLVAAGHTDILLLSCMDYRLVDETERYMVRRGFKHKYDHIVLAGGALGAVTDKFPAWNKTFWDELGLAIDLHHIHKVMLMDHRDCGAYKQVFGEDFAKHPKKETEAHATQLKQLKEQIKNKYEKLEVELLLMNLKGKVERI